MIPIISIIGYKKSGKTRLIEGLVPELKKRGYSVGTIKHTCHELKPEDVDRKGTDTYQHQICGAETIVLSSSNKIMMVKELKSSLSIDEIRKRYLGGLDFILTEGYKFDDKPKIEVFRHEVAKEEKLLSSQEKDNLVAVVSDRKFDIGLPCFGLDEYSKIADFLEKEFIAQKQVTKIELIVDQKKIPLNGFVDGVLKKTILAMISSLRGVPESPLEIEIKISGAYPN